MKKEDYGVLIIFLSALFLVFLFSYVKLTGNVVIEQDSVILNSTLGTNFTDEDLVLNLNQELPSDLKIIYTWYKNDLPLYFLNIPFENNTGNVSTSTKDYSPYRNYGNVLGASWSSSSGYDGFGAYEFDDESDFIEIPLNETTDFSGSFTISFWIKPKESSSFIYSEDLTPAMFSATVPSPYRVLYDYGADFFNVRPPHKAFDHYYGFLDSWASKDPPPQWIAYDFGEDNEKIIEKYTLTSINQRQKLDFSPKEWVLSGSNDYGEWVVLDNRTNEPRWDEEEKREYYFDNVNSYRYYRINITDNFEERRNQGHNNNENDNRADDTHNNGNNRDYGEDESEGKIYLEEIEFFGKIIGKSAVVSANKSGEIIDLINWGDRVEFSVNEKILSSESLDLNEWHQIIAVFDDENNKIKLYVDGNYSGEENEENNFNASSLNLSRNDYLGFIDDLKIYNSALSEEQVKYLSEGNENIISSNETSAGDVFYCEILVNNGLEDSEKVSSNNLLVRDFLVCGDNVCSVGETTESCPIDCECQIDSDCSDEILCTIDSCINNQCQYYSNNSVCDDGFFCNGIETCDLITGCLNGIQVECNDNNDSTIDSCSNEINSCLYEPIITEDNDLDDDGIINDEDLCPNTPENLIAFVNIFGCPEPIAEKFDIKPDFHNINLFNVGETEIGIKNVGKISFVNENITFLKQTEGGWYSRLDLDSGITIETNSVTLNSTLLPEMNKSALITMVYSNISNLAILRDGQKCSECEVISVDEQTSTVVFRVRHFTTYELIDETAESGEDNSEEPPSESASPPATGNSGGSGGGGGGGSSGGGGIIPPSSEGSNGIPDNFFSDGSGSNNQEGDTQNKSGESQVLSKIPVNFQWIILFLLILILLIVIYIIWKTKDKKRKR
ncbi:MAG: LamG-like jellyroll fold domain-containing protein [archaeon]